MNRICEESGEGIEIVYDTKSTNKDLTCVEDGKCPWWDAFSSACKEEKLSIFKTIFPASTDSKYLRSCGIPAIGFSPMNNTPILLHDHNEFLNENVFLRGIDIYCSIISKLANMNSIQI